METKANPEPTEAPPGRVAPKLDLATGIAEVCGVVRLIAFPLAGSDRTPRIAGLLNHPIGQINRMLVLQCQIAVPLHNDREPPVRAVICLVPVAQAVKTRAPINRAPTRVYPTPMRNVRVVEMRDRDPRGRPLRPGKLGGRNAIPSVDRTVANVNGLEARTGTNKL